MPILAVRLAPIALVIAAISAALVLQQPATGPGGNVGQPSPSAVASPTQTATGTVFDTASEAPNFGLGVRITLPDGWAAKEQTSRLMDLINTGGSSDRSTWWGPGIALTDGAQVHNPADPSFDDPADSDPSRRIPWPDDFAGYLASLPGTTVVSGPEPITIDGVTGTAVTVVTEPMPPIMILKDDSYWIGGGSDVAVEHLFVTLDVHGTPVLLSFEDLPDLFDTRLPEVQSVFGSMRWDAPPDIVASPSSAP